MPQKHLYFFTAKFPFGQQETFIENEIPYLADRFEEVTIFPYNIPGDSSRTLPENTKVISRPKELSRPNFGIALRKLPTFLPILLLEFSRVQEKGFFLRHLRHWLACLTVAWQEGEWLVKEVGIPDDIVCYSFWMDNWALVLALLKQRGKINRFQFNCNGYDLWDERHPGNYLPFRRFIYSQASWVRPNTQLGADYIRKKDMYPEKVIHRYYGTRDFGMNPFNSEDRFTLVSISNMIPLKRIHLIIEILHYIQRPMRWIHFGDGELMNSLKIKAEEIPNHVLVDFRGRVSNHEIHTFFQSVSVNLFITTSETEGLPTSIMEAMSYGIPTMATDVGGISEEVGPETGILIPAEFDPAEIASQLEAFIDSSQNTPAFRQRVRAYWERHFSAKVNHREFAEALFTGANPSSPTMKSETASAI